MVISEVSPRHQRLSSKWSKFSPRSSGRFQATTLQLTSHKSNHMDTHWWDHPVLDNQCQDSPPTSMIYKSWTRLTFKLMVMCQPSLFKQLFQPMIWSLVWLRLPTSWLPEPFRPSSTSHHHSVDSHMLRRTWSHRTLTKSSWARWRNTRETSLKRTRMPVHSAMSICYQARSTFPFPSEEAS